MTNDHVTSSNNSPSLHPANRCTSTPINEKYIVDKVLTTTTADNNDKKTGGGLNRSLTVNNTNDVGKHKKTLSLNYK